MQRVLLSKKIIVAFTFLLTLNFCAKSQAFITTWITTDNTITIPTTGSGYTYDIAWTNLTNSGIGNGSITARTGSHTIIGLTNGDTYQVAITGAFPSVFFNHGTEKLKIRSIAQWGNIAWASMGGAFAGCSNLGYTATDVPNLAGVMDLSGMFAFCSIFNGNISSWNTSTITNMAGMFNSATVFNQPIGNWNTAAVTNMSAMFYLARAFNQPISNWNTSAVTRMDYMFNSATVFNQPIGNWNTAAVTNMYAMFPSATTFNQPIGNWNTTAVTNMNAMFYYATAFNQPISNWNTSTVTDMFAMFCNAIAFNQPLSSWDITNVTNMNRMLENCKLSVTNYDNILISWAAQTVKPNVTLGALNLKYCNSIAARNTLMGAPNNWTITGDVSNCTVLPISLLNFEGKRQNENTVQLQWQTTNEVNNNFFEIELSNDGTSFKKIGSVIAAGNSSTIKNYSFNINNTTANYYRLKQIDNNGAFEYSNVVFIKSSNVKAISIFPNPSNGNFEINITNTIKQYPAHIYNTQGVKVWSGLVTGSSNKMKTKLCKGFYFLHVVLDGENKIEKLVIE